jgi:hypothetical protein
VRRLVQIAAGLGLAWLALQAGAHAEPPPPAVPALEAAALAAPVPPIGPAYDADAAMAQHADEVASYTLHASLDPVKHDITAKGTITWKNASRVAQSEVWLHLYLNAFKSDRTYFMRFPVGEFRGAGTLDDWGHVTVTRFAMEGGPDLWPGADKTSPGDPDDETDIRVPLPDPVAPGATVRIDVEFASHLPSLLFRTGHFKGFHMVGQWFPKLARLEPDGRWAHFPFHRLSEFYADFGAYDVTLDTPEGVVVGATGEPQGEVREGGRVKRRFVQHDVHDFAFTAWTDFRELRAQTPDGIALRVLYPPGYDHDAEVQLEAARFGLVHLGEAYGRYPYKTLTLVHPPAGADEAGGMEYPTLITTGGPWYDAYTGSRFLEIVTIHELGHQWFYGMVATDEHGWPFLDEGVNSYSEIDAMEALHPGASAFAGFGLGFGIAAFDHFAATEAAGNAPVAQPASSFVTGGDYGSLVYARTATILWTLGNVYGPDRIRRAIGRYTRRYRFQHPGPAELLQAIREVLGEDAAEQARVALFEKGTVDYAVSDLFSEPDEPPHGEAADAGAPEKPDAKAEAKEKAAPSGYRGSALVRRRGALRFPVDVDLIGEDGSVTRVRWSAEEASARLPWKGKSRLAAAVIDPEHRVLLDDDLGNNARSRSSRRLSGALLDRFSFDAAAALGGVLP